MHCAHVTEHPLRNPFIICIILNFHSTLKGLQIFIKEVLKFPLSHTLTNYKYIAEL